MVAKLVWKPYTRSSCQWCNTALEAGYRDRPLLWTAVFNVFLNDQKDEIKSMLIKFKSGANFPKYWNMG